MLKAFFRNLQKCHASNLSWQLMLFETNLIDANNFVQILAPGSFTESKEEFTKHLASTDETGFR